MTDEEKCEETAIAIGNKCDGLDAYMIAKMITAYLQERHNQDWRSIRLDHDA